MLNGFMSVDKTLGAGRACLRSLYEEYAAWGWGVILVLALLISKCTVTTFIMSLTRIIMTLNNSFSILFKTLLVIKLTM